MNAIIFGDIVEENGKTIRENNMGLKHNIPIGSLVEVKLDEWHGNGACEISKSRLWVISHDRDCDGTPLYTLSQNHPDHLCKGSVILDGYILRDGVALSILNNFKTGFSEDSLKMIELTDELKKGVGALSWEDSK